MQGLSDLEQKLAWNACWTPSLTGKAIVNEDFTFRSVNPEFCDILKVTPAELIGQNFKDITTQELRQLDANNAKLVKQGIMQSYMLPKTYEFNNGRTVNVVLFVNGVFDEAGEFLFYVSQIVLDKAAPKPADDSGVILLDFIKEYKTTLAYIGSAIGAIVYGILEYIKGKA